MTLVGYDEIESVDGNINMVGVLIRGLITNLWNYVSAKQIDGHSLDRAYVDECKTRVRVRQV